MFCSAYDTCSDLITHKAGVGYAAQVKQAVGDTQIACMCTPLRCHGVNEFVTASCLRQSPVSRSGQEPLSRRLQERPKTELFDASSNIGPSSSVSLIFLDVSLPQDQFRNCLIQKSAIPSIWDASDLMLLLSRRTMLDAGWCAHGIIYTHRNGLGPWSGKEAR